MNNQGIANRQPEEGGSDLKRNPKQMIMAATMAAFLLVTIFATPTQSSAQVKLDSVIIKVGTENVIVDLVKYAMAVAGSDNELLTYLKSGAANAKVEGVVINNKNVSLVDYAMAVGQGQTAEQVYETSTHQSFNNLAIFVEFKDGNAVTEKVSDTPDTEQPSEEFEVEDIQ